jgi:hypothetical protein
MFFPITLPFILVLLVPVYIGFKREKLWPVSLIKVTSVLVLRDGNSPPISADGKRIAVSPRIGLRPLSRSGYTQLDTWHASNHEIGIELLIQ